MNPWALVLVVISIFVFILIYKGTQDNVIAAILGRPFGNSSIGGTTTQTTSAVSGAGGQSSVRGALVSVSPGTGTLA